MSVDLDFRARLITGASYARALLADDAQTLVSMKKAFTDEELLAVLTPQFLTVATKLAEYLGDIPVTELGDRLLEAARLYPR